MPTRRRLFDFTLFACITWAGLEIPFRTKMADQQTDTDSLDVFDRITDAIVTKPQRTVA